MNGPNPDRGGLFAALGLLAVVVTAASAGVMATAPGEPISFYGAAADADGTPAPAGTVVVAAVDGETVDSITVAEPGVYAGDGPTDEKLRTHTEAGDEVTFHVGGVDGPRAAETHAIDEAGVFELDLTFPAGTFEVDPGDPGSSGGGGGSAGGGSAGGGGTDDADSENRITVEASLEAADGNDSDGTAPVRTASVAVSAPANSIVEIDLTGGGQEADDDGQSDQDGDAGSSGPGASVERIEIDVVADVDAEVEIRQSAAPPSEDGVALVADDGTEPAGYLQIETNLDDDQIESARIDFRMSRAELDAEPENVALYHYDEAVGEWEELPTTVIEVTDDVIRFRAETEGFSEFAVGIKRAQFEIVDAGVDETALETGETVEVAVTVANTGGADGTFTVELRVDDDQVAQSSVSVGPDSTRTTVLEHTFGAPGTYELRVDDISIAEVEVAAPTDDGGADEPAAGEGESDPDENDADDGPAEPDGSQGVGFVAGLAALLVAIVLGGAVLYRWRRR